MYYLQSMVQKIVALFLVSMASDFLECNACHTAAALLGIAARMGSNEARYKLGASIVYGNHGNRYSLDEGYRLIKNSAQQGYDPAKNWLVAFAPLVIEPERGYSLRAQIQRQKIKYSYLERNARYLEVVVIHLGMLWVVGSVLRTIVNLVFHAVMN